MLTRRTSFLASIHEVDDEPEIFVTTVYNIKPNHAVTLSATIVSPHRGLSNLTAPDDDDIGETDLRTSGGDNPEGITWQKKTTPTTGDGVWINLDTDWDVSRGKCTYTIPDVGPDDYGSYIVFVPGSTYQDVTYPDKYSSQVELINASDKL